MSTLGWTYLFVTITFLVYLYIGWRSRVRETQGFYVAGHGVPAIANGAATAADWMSAASFISMAGLVSFLGYGGSAYLLGWTGGYVLLALLLAPYLRKFGKYTVPDFVGARYESETARVVAAICAIFISLTYVAGQMRGVGIVFSRFLEVPLPAGVVVGMLIVAFFAVLGGMKGITWTQVVQYFILIIAFYIPTVALSQMLTGSGVPQVGFTDGEFWQKLNQVQTDLGFGSYTEPFTSSSQLNVLLLALALMMGTAGLPHVIVRFYTTPTVRAARWSGFWALLFIALLYTAAPALAGFARYSLLETLDGAQIEKIAAEDLDETYDWPIYRLRSANAAGAEGEKVQRIKWVEKWQKTGLIRFEDRNGDGRVQMNRPEGVSGGRGNFVEATVDPDIMVVATPEIAGLAPWIIALVATGGLAAALSTAAGLLLVISSSIAHDLYIHYINPQSSERRRVMVGRVMIVLAIGVAGYFGIYPPGFVGEVVAFAFGLAAASFFPVILLGIFDSRTNRAGAVSGMIVGIGFTSIYILGNTADKILPGVSEPWFGPWLFGIESTGIGVVGCLLNFVITFTVSRLTAPPSEATQQLVQNVRYPAESHEPEAHFSEEDAEADNP